MMAAAGRESHRSPSAERRLLSPPGRASLGSEEGGSRSRAETNDESIFDGGPAAAGVAGLEADVGNTDIFFDATPGKQQHSVERKKPPKDGHGRGGRKNKSHPRGRSPAAATSATDATHVAPVGPQGSTAPVAAVDAVDASATMSGEVGIQASAKAPAAVGAATKVPTRERSQKMYETYFQTQEKLKNMRDESATSGCTFAPQLSAKQKGRKSGEDSDPPDHLYQDFHKQLEKRERLAEEERQKISFRPVLPTASSRLAAKIAATDPSVDGHKRAEDKSKATAEAMYKECTFSPNTVVTKPLTEKILAAKGKQAEVADRLYASAETQAALAKTREEARVAKELAACTFRPDTSGSSKRSSAGSGRGDSGNTHERLFGLHGELLMSKQTKKEELAARELMECTFAPALVAKSVVPSSSDSDKGVKNASTDKDAAARGSATGAERAESIHERLYKLRVRAEASVEFLEPECTFQPDLALTNKSLASARCRGKTEDKGERRMDVLYKHGRQRQAARSQSPRNYSAKFREDDESKEMELCTFQPNVSTTQTGRFKTESRGKALFATLYGQRGDRDRARDRAWKEDMKACPFSPTLSSHKTRVGRSLSPRRERPVYEELYGEAATQRLARTMSAEYIQSQECPFKPNMATARSRTSRAGTSSATRAPIEERRQASPLSQPPSSQDHVAASTPAAAVITAAATAEGDGGGTAAQKQKPIDDPWDGAMPTTASASAAATAGGRKRAAEKDLGGETGTSVVPPAPPAATASSSSSTTPKKSAGRARGKTGTNRQSRVEVSGAPKEASKATSEVENKTATIMVAATTGPAAATGTKIPSAKTKIPTGVPSAGGGEAMVSPPPPAPAKEQG